MLEPGTTVDPDGIAGRGGRLPAEIQSGAAAQPAGLREPGGFCGAELSIPSSGRASPSLRWGGTKNKQKHKLNHVPGLTHGLDQKSEPGHPACAPVYSARYGVPLSVATYASWLMSVGAGAAARWRGCGWWRGR